ncbi:hypothetical protein BGX23_004107 [Mortierella sp. AD031]|nr:hypothetical protein BGX23_004107 [Mortierella sp. AD031]KAG0215076.1 hypothetical protein BGX33_001511 [Mortierella sp. NVP41]
MHRPTPTTPRTKPPLSRATPLPQNTPATILSTPRPLTSTSPLPYPRNSNFTSSTTATSTNQQLFDHCYFETELRKLRHQNNEIIRQVCLKEKHIHQSEATTSKLERENLGLLMALKRSKEELQELLVAFQQQQQQQQQQTLQHQSMISPATTAESSLQDLLAQVEQLLIQQEWIEPNIIRHQDVELAQAAVRFHQQRHDLRMQMRSFAAASDDFADALHTLRDYGTYSSRNPTPSTRNRTRIQRSASPAPFFDVYKSPGRNRSDRTSQTLDYLSRSPLARHGRTLVSGTVSLASGSIGRASMSARGEDRIGIPGFDMNMPAEIVARTLNYSREIVQRPRRPRAESTLPALEEQEGDSLSDGTITSSSPSSPSSIRPAPLVHPRSSGSQTLIVGSLKLRPALSTPTTAPRHSPYRRLPTQPTPRASPTAEVTKRHIESERARARILSQKLVSKFSNKAAPDHAGSSKDASAATGQDCGKPTDNTASDAEATIELTTASSMNTTSGLDASEDDVTLQPSRLPLATITTGRTPKGTGPKGKHRHAFSTKKLKMLSNDQLMRRMNKELHGSSRLPVLSKDVVAKGMASSLHIAPSRRTSSATFATWPTLSTSAASSASPNVAEWIDNVINTIGAASSTSPTSSDSTAVAESTDSAAVASDKEMDDIVLDPGRTPPQPPSPLQPGLEVRSLNLRQRVVAVQVPVYKPSHNSKTNSAAASRSSSFTGSDAADRLDARLQGMGARGDVNGREGEGDGDGDGPDSTSAPTAASARTATVATTPVSAATTPATAASSIGNKFRRVTRSAAACTPVISKSL